MRSLNFVPKVTLCGQWGVWELAMERFIEGPLSQTEVREAVVKWNGNRGNAGSEERRKEWARRQTAGID